MANTHFRRKIGLYYKPGWNSSTSVAPNINLINNGMFLGYQDILVEDMSILNHSWNLETTDYNDSIYLSKAELESKTYDISIKASSAWIYNGSFYLPDSLIDYVNSLKQAFNTDVNSKTPGRLYYLLYNPSGTVADRWITSYSTGFVTNFSVNPIDDRGFKTNIQLTFESIDGKWYQEKTFTGSSNTGTPGRTITGFNNELDCDYVLTLKGFTYGTSSSTYAWPFIAGVGGNRERYYSSKYYNTGKTLDKQEGSTTIRIDSKKNLFEGQITSSGTTTWQNLRNFNEIPSFYFNKLETAGATSLYFNTPCQYELLLYQESTMPFMKKL